MNMEKTTQKQKLIFDGYKYQPAFDPELDAMDGVTDEERTRRFQMAVRMAILTKRIKKVPIACYDEETKQAYLEYPDGHREYANY